MMVRDLFLSMGDALADHAGKCSVSLVHGERVNHPCGSGSADVFRELGRARDAVIAFLSAPLFCSRCGSPNRSPLPFHPVVTLGGESLCIDCARWVR